MVEVVSSSEKQGLSDPRCLAAVFRLKDPTAALCITVKLGFVSSAPVERRAPHFTKK